MRHPSLEISQTRRLVADIRRVIDILNAEIAGEETQAGISDPALPEYSALARTLIARRQNLESTLALLEDRMVADSPVELASRADQPGSSDFTNRLRG